MVPPALLVSSSGLESSTHPLAQHASTAHSTVHHTRFITLSRKKTATAAATEAGLFVGLKSSHFDLHLVSVASALVKVGKPKVFLSVLMPFEDGADPVEIADEIRTRSGGEGVEANFADTLTVKIGADGSWAVERQAGR